MSPTDLFSVLGWVTQAIQTLRTGRRERDPYRQAIHSVQWQYLPIRRPLGDTLHKLRSDPSAQDALAALVGGNDSAMPELVDRFIHLTSIRNPDREAVERWLVSFLRYLHRDALPVGSTPWVLYQQIRTGSGPQSQEQRDAESVRPGSMVSAMRSPITNPVRPAGNRASPTTDREDSMLAAARAEADRLFRAGAFVMARAHFSSMLAQHTDSSPLDHDTIYRLHLGRAACSMLLDDLEDAEHAIHEAFRYRPEGPRAHAMLAQLAMSRADLPKARSLAKQLLEQHPEQRDAWLVLLQTSDGAPRISDIPKSLRDDPSIQLALGTRLASLGQLSEALRTTRTAARSVTDDPQLGIAAAELLLFLTCQLDSSAPSQDLAVLIRGLISGVLALTSIESSSRLAARALAAQSTLNLVIGDITGSLKDAKHAMAADSESPEARFAYARALRHSGDPEAALSVLDHTMGRSSEADTLILRASLLLDADRSTSEIESAIEAARTAADADPHRTSFLAALAGLAAEAGIAPIASQLIDEIENDAPDYVALCFRARLSKHHGDEDRTCDLYEKALAHAPAHQRIKLSFEYATAALGYGRFTKVADLIEDAGVPQAPDFILAVYVDALARLGRLDKIAEVVRLVGRRASPLPSWALDAASYVALRRDDPTSAMSQLEELLGRGDPPVELELRLAYAYCCTDRAADALSLLQQICSRPNLPGPARLQSARLLCQLDQHDEAIREAYLALRTLPPSSETDALYVSIFMAAPEDVPVKADPGRITVNTSPTLRREDGREVHYHILDPLMTTHGHFELSADSSEAKPLLGRSVGDSVTLRPQDLDPARYTVTEIHTLWSAAFRDALERAQTGISLEPSPIQSMKIQDSESGLMLAPMTSMLQQQRERQAVVDSHYSNGSVPLAMLGRASGRSCRESYYHAVNLKSGLLVAEGATSPTYISHTTVLRADAIVIHTSGLITLQELGLLEILPALFSEIRVPTSAIVELRSDLQQMRGMRVREVAWASLEGERLVVDQVPKHFFEEQEGKLHDLIEWTTLACVQLGCPEEGMSPEGVERRDVLGPPSYDACMLADPAVPLYADDLVLRRLVEVEHGAKSFSTVALLEAAVAAKEMDETDRNAAVSGLIGLNHRFIPISVGYLLHACETDGYELGPTLRAGIDRLLGATGDRAAQVFAGFIRALSVTPVVGATLTVVIRYLLKTMSAANRRRDIAIVRAHVREALRLHPLAWTKCELAFAEHQEGEIRGLLRPERPEGD